MRDDNTIPQDEREGGYGGDTGAQDPRPGEQGASAGGRGSELTSPMDADEALGNRTGGYGGNPASTEGERESGAETRTERER